MKLFSAVLLVVFFTDPVSASCGRCNNIRVNLKCLKTDASYPIEATKGLACDVISGGITLQCEVEGLINKNATSFNFKSGTKDIADFSLVTRKDADKANGTMVVETVASDIVYYCEATVADMNSDSHVLRSNTIIVKKMSQDTSKITVPTKAEGRDMSEKSYITVLPCSLPTGWYPEPTVTWYKGDAAVTPSVRVFPLDLTVGDYKKGSLILHGYKEAEDKGEYKCVIHYTDYAAWLAAKQKTEGGKEETKEKSERQIMIRKTANTQADMTAYKKNITVSWYNVKLGFVSTAEKDVTEVGVGRVEDGRFLGWGQPLNFTAVAVGGAIGNVMGTDRVTYKWTITGSELGLQKLNTTCVDIAKNSSSTKQRREEKSEEKKNDTTSSNKTEEVKKTYTVQDFMKYTSCRYWVVADKERTLVLTNESLPLLGITQFGPNGNSLSLPGYSYGFDQSKFTVDVTFAGKNSETKGTEKQALYQGVNVVSGATPPSDKNTCAYNDKSLALPLSSHFYQKWKSAEFEPLAEYPLLDACIFKNAAQGGFIVEATEVYNLQKLAEKSAAKKCQYYQVQRRNQRADNLWSYLYQTVLVETLGDQGENPDYKAEQFKDSTVVWTSSEVKDKTKTVTCTSSTAAKTGTLNYLELTTDCESYTLAAGKPDSTSCGYSTAVDFDMTTMSKNCTIKCMSKSQCSGTVTKNMTVEPIFCTVPTIKNATLYTTDNKVAPAKILYTTELKVACADGFQREGPDKLTCQVDGSFDANVSCVDLNIVTCPTLDAGFGSLDCNTTAKPVSCSYSCPKDQYFENSGGNLTSTMEVTCNTSSAQWSHMSKTNPLGTLPTCSKKTAATSYKLTAKIGFSGADSCIDGLTAALTDTLKSSDDAAYACMDSGDCAIDGNAKCTSQSGTVTLEFVIKQTKGTLTTSATIDAFHAQLKKDVAAKTFTLKVGSKKRRKRATTLTADGSLVSAATAGCPSGSGTVGTNCIQCPTGQYESSGKCTDCAVNTYSDSVGSTKCTDCPTNLKTITTGSDSKSDCTVICTVKDVKNGFRSPGTGYTVPEGTKITTFCDTNYGIQHNTSNLANCTATQPECHANCVVKSIDDRAKMALSTLKAGSTFSFKEKLDYTCSNKDKDNFNVQCDTAGTVFDLSCPTSYAAAIAGAVVAFVAVVTTIVVARVIIIRNRPVPEMPEQENMEKSHASSSPESVLGFVTGKIANFSEKLKV